MNFLLCLIFHFLKKKSSLIIIKVKAMHYVFIWGVTILPPSEGRQAPN